MSTPEELKAFMSAFRSGSVTAKQPLPWPDPNRRAWLIRHYGLDVADRWYHPTSGSFVYVITNPAWPNYCKVGYTTNLRSRLTDYNVADPNKAYRYAAYFSVSDLRSAEDQAHSILSSFRVAGTEWFNIPAEDAVRLLDGIGTKAS
jgi:hypothetical protein